MCRRGRWAFLGGVLSLLVAAPVAEAKVFELTAGVKAGVGVEVWMEPSGTTYSYLDDLGDSQSFDIPFFDETRSGYNYSIGMYMEMRFFRYIGLDVGFFITRHAIVEDTDWTYTEIDQSTSTVRRYRTKTEQELVFTAFRIPIIVKGILPVGEYVRLSLGIGPEIAVGSYARARFSHVGGDALQGRRQQFQGLTAVEQTDTYLAIVFGVDVKAGDFRVPIDLRFAYNFSQPDSYFDRVTYDVLPGNGSPAGVHPTTGEFKARDSMYFQLMVGVAFDYY